MERMLRVVCGVVCFVLISCTTNKVPIDYHDSTPPEVAFDVFDIPVQDGETKHANPETVPNNNTIERVVPMGKEITLVATGIDPEGIQDISITWQSMPECRRADGSIIARGKPSITISNTEDPSASQVQTKRTVTAKIKLSDCDCACALNETFVRQMISVSARSANYGNSQTYSGGIRLMYPAR